jgi:hypothetical protein
MNRILKISLIAGLLALGACHVPRDAYKASEIIPKCKPAGIVDYSGRHKFLIHSDSNRIAYIPGRLNPNQSVRIYDRVCDHFVFIP